MCKEISKEMFKTLVVATTIITFLLAYFTVKSALQMAFVPSVSMVPTLQVSDVAIVHKMKSPESIQHEDIVLFMPNTEENAAFLPTSKYPYVKRVIGLPGDTIEVSDGVLYVNGEPQIKNYTAEKNIAYDFEQITVPEGSYFMMGDNRNQSNDSRVIGSIPAENIIGKVIWHNRNPILSLLKMTPDSN